MRDMFSKFTTTCSVPLPWEGVLDGDRHKDERMKVRKQKKIKKSVEALGKYSTQQITRHEQKQEKDLSREGKLSILTGVMLKQ